MARNNGHARSNVPKGIKSVAERKTEATIDLDRHISTGRITASITPDGYGASERREATQELRHFVRSIESSKLKWEAIDRPNYTEGSVSVTLKSE
jgi:hypothetical protein